MLFRPEAEADLAAAVSFYEDKRPGLGRDLIAAVERALAAIEEAPGAQPLFHHGHAHRRYKLARFPVVIVFSEDEAQAVTVIAVAHAKQPPGPPAPPGP
jgi:plasmid stabilization system protein ParE